MDAIVLRSYAAGGRLLGTRAAAVGVRSVIESRLMNASDIEIDFDGTAPTQSFIDELIGALVLKHGEGVLDHLVLKNCSAEAKQIVHFVISDRIDQIRTSAAYL